MLELHHGHQGFVMQPFVRAGYAADWPDTHTWQPENLSQLVPEHLVDVLSFRTDTRTEGPREKRARTSSAAHVDSDLPEFDNDVQPMTLAKLFQVAEAKDGKCLDSSHRGVWEIFDGEVV